MFFFPMPSNHRVWSRFNFQLRLAHFHAQTTATKPQRQIVNGVLTFIGFASVEILINSHQNSPFNRGNTYDRAVTVLHELGHAFDIIMNAGGSHLATNDPGPLSAANTALVRRNCP